MARKSKKARATDAIGIIRKTFGTFKPLPRNPKPKDAPSRRTPRVTPDVVPQALPPGGKPGDKTAGGKPVAGNPAEQTLGEHQHADCIQHEIPLRLNIEVDERLGGGAHHECEERRSGHLVIIVRAETREEQLERAQEIRGVCLDSKPVSQDIEGTGMTPRQRRSVGAGVSQVCAPLSNPDSCRAAAALGTPGLPRVVEDQLAVEMVAHLAETVR